MTKLRPTFIGCLLLCAGGAGAVYWQERLT